MYTATVEDEFGTVDSYTQYSSEVEATRVARGGAKRLHGRGVLAIVQEGHDVVVKEFRYEDGEVNTYDDEGTLLTQSD